jgi:haloacetate dehalogenase
MDASAGEFMSTSTRRDLIRNAAVLGVGGLSANDPLLSAIEATKLAGQDRTSADFFPGFKKDKKAVSGAEINFVVGGSGPGLLLLHGYPQTHVMWRKIAPQVSKKFTVVIPDLRGYGDSSKPPDGENHFGYSKRTMAQDQVEVMESLGFKRFAVVGHDRGGRVAHRMVLDHANAVEKLAVLDIVPTYKLYHTVTKEFATAYWHWFFLIQPAPFPETLIGDNVEFYLKSRFFGRISPSGLEDQAFAEYLRCFRDPATIHASCEDYRAAASVDLDHDAADLNQKISCPVLALWAEQGAMQQLFNVLDTWRERASNVNGKSLPGGHFLPEQSPQVLLKELARFLA